MLEWENIDLDGCLFTVCDRKLLFSFTVGTCQIKINLWSCYDQSFDHVPVLQWLFRLFRAVSGIKNTSSLLRNHS